MTDDEQSGAEAGEQPAGGEHATVERTDRPVTVERLSDDLRALGVGDGPVLVHSSLSALGWVAGGAQAAVEALVDVVASDGTLVMPTHSTQLSDPRHWSAPPVPDDWHDQIRERTPPFRPAVTPTRGMGAVPECFRCHPGVVRSRHPLYSFAALGADAEAIVADHEYVDGLGEASPLAALCERDARVLLLGVGHDANTSLHLAEYRADYPKERTTQGGPVVEDGERRWVDFEEVAGDTGDFPDVGAAFERQHPESVAEGTVGEATATLLDQRALVEFAAAWFGDHRTGE